MRKIFIKDYMYQCNYTLITDCTQKECGDYLRKLYDPNFKDPEADACLTVFEKREKDGKVVQSRFIYISSFSFKKIEISLLVHELLHLTFDVLGTLGIRYCKESEESYTYYLQSCLVECLFHLDKKNVSKLSRTKKTKRK